jgi:hypothetical protein
MHGPQSAMFVEREREIEREREKERERKIESERESELMSLLTISFSSD